MKAQFVLLLFFGGTSAAFCSAEPERVVIHDFGRQAAEADCRTALQRGDLRFFAIPQFQPLHPLEYPGVPNYAEEIVKSHGVKMIKPPVAPSHSSEAEEYETQAAIYAQTYNRFLLSQIPGSDKPPTGYGISKPSDVVSRGVELTTGDISQGRDLASYDQGGHFDCRRYTDKHLPVRNRQSRVRKFIWDHWTQKHRGYIRETGNSVDAQATIHFFIEPASDVWRVACRIVRSEAYPTKEPNIDDVEAFSVEQKQPRRGDENRNATYILVFKNKDGAEVMRY